MEIYCGLKTLAPSEILINVQRSAGSACRYTCTYILYIYIYLVYIGVGIHNNVDVDTSTIEEILREGAKAK